MGTPIILRIMKFRMQTTTHRRLTPPIQSLDRGLTILEAVAKSVEPVPLGELTELLGIDRSSAFRLANTLRRRGFLAHPTGSKYYILGPSVWRLSHQYDWGNMLVKVAHEHLKALAGETDETAHLAIREGKQAMFVDHAATNHVIAVAGQTGEVVPLHSTAHGKALLADFDKSELKALFGFGPLRPCTKRTVISLDQLAKICSQIQVDGFAWDDAEYREDLRCVAAPIRGPEGTIVGSIGISAPLSRFPKERYRICGEQVSRIARQISAILNNEGSDI
jgi:DNA-binding IclR family transcriptional regulator